MQSICVFLKEDGFSLNGCDFSRLGESVITYLKGKDLVFTAEAFPHEIPFTERWLIKSALLRKSIADNPSFGGGLGAAYGVYFSYLFPFDKGLAIIKVLKLSTTAKIGGLFQLGIDLSLNALALANHEKTFQSAAIDIAWNVGVASVSAPLGAIVGGFIGSIIPGAGTAIGMIAGAVIAYEINKSKNFFMNLF